MTDMICVWHIADECSEDITRHELFDHQIAVNMCAKCFIQHNIVMYLHEQGMNLDVMLKISDGAREELSKAYEYINSDEYKQEINKREQVLSRIRGE